MELVRLTDKSLWSTFRLEQEHRRSYGLLHFLWLYHNDKKSKLEND